MSQCASGNSRNLGKGRTMFEVKAFLVRYISSLTFMCFANVDVVYCPEHVRLKENDQADKLAGKAPSQVACFSEDLKC